MKTLLDLLKSRKMTSKRKNLPGFGFDSVESLKAAGDAAISSISGLADLGHPFPMNRPLSVNGVKLPGGYGDTAFQSANNRTIPSDIAGPAGNALRAVSDLTGDTFEHRYGCSASFKQTLQDLCPSVGTASVFSLFELTELLKASPYISTPGKFTTNTKHSYNVFSLDSNIYWEITMEPYCSDKESKCSNGGFSFLPSIDEINYINYYHHGVVTNYGTWIPVNGFELQKSKLITKSLSLYEGEISYPVGMEFTNELRLTFVDDSMKSWKKYFEKCAEVSVYNSEPHIASYYDSPKNYLERITAVDKTMPCVALYKNIAFLITIYILSPQYNLLKKYPLLCVLKDFSEDYIGEIDGGGVDLNVSFSIVGENPDFGLETVKSKKAKAMVAMKKNLIKNAAIAATNLIQTQINQTMSILG